MRDLEAESSQEPEPEPEPAPLSLPQRIIEAHALEAIERMKTVDLVTHPGERGRAREEILRQYLVETVPEGFTVASGFIIDVHGAQSRQQDLIVVRRDYHPRFQVGGAQFLPVEAVAAVIEVKSALDSRSLLDAIDNARSVKTLDRTGGGSNYLVEGGIGGHRGRDVDAENDDHQILSLIVAARSLISAETAYRNFAEALEYQPRRTWPNAVTVAEAWHMVYDVPEGEPRTSVHLATAVMLHKRESENNIEPLVDVALDLWSWLRVAPLIDVAPMRYVRPSSRGIVGTIPDRPRPGAVVDVPEPPQ